MKIFSTLMLVVSYASAQTCISNNKNACLSNITGGFESFLATGNPCFLLNNKRWCFTSDEGNMAPCTCTPECGCDNGIVFPACDNSVVPKNPNCTSDQDTYCPASPISTMCIYCEVNITNCGAVCTRGLNETEIQIVVDTHNNLRRNVAKGLETQGVGGQGQPSAADMYQLEWDPALAVVAQRWTDQCTPGHDKDRQTVGYNYVGQNYAASSSSAQTLDKGLANLVTLWYNEVKDWPSANINKFSEEGSTGVTGHYTQLVWGSTKKIGCGYIGSKKGWFNSILICNYGEGGNVMGAPVYTIGEPGSKCSNGNNDGLCL